MSERICPHGRRIRDDVYDDSPLDPDAVHAYYEARGEELCCCCLTPTPFPEMYLDICHTCARAQGISEASIAAAAPPASMN